MAVAWVLASHVSKLDKHSSATARRMRSYQGLQLGSYARVSLGQPMLPINIAAAKAADRELHGHWPLKGPSVGYIYIYTLTRIFGPRLVARH